MESGLGSRPWWPRSVQRVLPYALLPMLLFLGAVLVYAFTPQGSCTRLAFQPDGWERIVLRQAKCVAEWVASVREGRGRGVLQPDGPRSAPPPPPPPPPPPSPRPRPPRPSRPLGAAVPPRLVAGDAHGATRVYGRRPSYPEVARRARVCGAVVLEVVVGRAGTVTDVVVVHSVPLLDEAAIGAARLWQYTPMLLEARSTPFIDLVQINFELEVLEGRRDATRTWVVVDAAKPPACPG